jgi:nitrite reductase/ring-hydroxylating ferredoxin subunit
MSGCTRREFHGLILAGSAAVLLPACGPFDGSATMIDGQVVLSFAQFPQLATVGGGVVVDVKGSFPIVVVRTADAGASALSATCTHQGCIVSYQPSGPDVHCDCHNANFSLRGAVERGPTDIPLPTYAAAVGASGVTVQISG